MDKELAIKLQNYLLEIKNFVVNEVTPPLDPIDMKVLTNILVNMSNLIKESVD